MMTYIALDSRFHPDQLGFLPGYISDDDPRSAREQLDAHQPGGWMPMQDWQLTNRLGIVFPGDPPLRPLAFTRLRDEMIVFYQHAQVMILRADGTFEVARCD
jgi:hypothetical protein